MGYWGISRGTPKYSTSAKAKSHPLEQTQNERILCVTLGMGENSSPSGEDFLGLWYATLRKGSHSIYDLKGEAQVL